MILRPFYRRDLDEKRKKEGQKQLLDICKSVPSLTIFLLPGSLYFLYWLSLFKMPSAFNENRWKWVKKSHKTTFFYKL
jgi:hypothetical protein